MQNRIKDLLDKYGMTAKDLADQVGMNAPAFRLYVRNESRLRPDLAVKIADIFGVAPDYVMGLSADNDVKAERDEIPLYGYARASIRGEAIITNNPIDYVERPPFVPRGVDAYAVTVTGNSMSPRLQPRDVVYAAPRLPVEAGDYCVVQFIQDGEQCAIIKQFDWRNDDKVSLHQTTPDTHFTIDTKDILALDRVCGLRM